VIRLFVALALPDDVRARLDGLCGGVPGASWVPSDDFHLTLRFIGDVSEGDAEDAHDALLGVRGNVFDLTLAGVGHFSTGPEVRVLWAGVERNDTLAQLQRGIESALVRMGFKREERRWSPHVTLARLAGTPLGRVQDFLAHHALFRAGPFRVDRFELFSSHRRPEGAIYRAEADYPLAMA
jgi:2'-5' RNA ligase